VRNEQELFLTVALLEDDFLALSVVESGVDEQHALLKAIV
jgi:hypothetical protein